MKIVPGENICKDDNNDIEESTISSSIHSQQIVNV